MSTCGSHLAVVSLFYGTVIAVYFQPTSRYEAEQGHVATVMYTVVTPMLNPVIYSLQNCDVQGQSEPLSLGEGSQLVTPEGRTPPRTDHITHTGNC